MNTFKTKNQMKHLIEKTDNISIILTDYLRSSVFSWGIRHHTHNRYTHAMIQYGPNHVAEQQNIFQRADMTKYLNGDYRIKRITMPYINSKLKYWDINENIETLLKIQPKYDWGGFFGFIFNIQKITQISYRYFCSEIVLTILKNSGLYTGDVCISPGDIDKLIMNESSCLPVEDIHVFDPTY